MSFPAALLPTTARAHAGAARLAAGSAIPAAAFIACRAWLPGAGPSAGKQASGAGGPTPSLAEVHHG